MQSHLRSLLIKLCHWKKLTVTVILKIILLASIVSSLFLVSFVLNSNQNPSISKERSSLQQCSPVIQDLCGQYHAGTVSGNLCDELCQTPVSNFRCLRPPGIGKTVLMYTNKNNLNIMLKSARPSDHNSPSITYLKSIETYEKGLEHLRLVSSDTSLNDSMFAHVLTHINYAGDNLFAQLLTGELLLSQDEYIKFVELQGLSLVPQLYGACGRYYASEYTPTDKATDINHLSLPWTTVGSWEERRQAALGLVELSDRLDRHNMSLCDVKGSNIGWLPDGQAVVLDADTLFTRKQLGLYLQQTQKCSSDRDCNWWDCHGKCDRRARACTSQISNTNLHAICSKIFISGWSNGLHGLLSSLPIKQSRLPMVMSQACYGYTISKTKHNLLTKTLRQELIVNSFLS